jgi:uncharacterized protein
MSGSDFRRAIADFIAEQARPREKFGHQPRLYALTLAVGKGQRYDDDVVYAAAWLHDLGVFTGHRPEDPEQLSQWDNTAYAMREAPAILERANFPAAKIPAVVEAIRTHQPGQKPESIEAAILRDADMLEQLGAVGILRTVCKVGRDTRFSDFTSAIRSLQKALAELPAKLTFDSSRELAAVKIQTLKSFLGAAENEAKPDLF